MSSFMDIDQGEEARPSVTPDRKALELAARAIQRGFGLSVIGFDMVWSQEAQTYYVIDINYFPSFADVPFQAHYILAHLRKVAGKAS